MCPMCVRQDWVWFTLTPDNKSLKVMESGDDGLEGGALPLPVQPSRHLTPELALESRGTQHSVLKGWEGAGAQL